MSIRYDEETRTFRLECAHSTYAFCVTRNGFLLHLYYGAGVPDTDLLFMAETSKDDPFPIASVETGGGRELDGLPMEYPTSGLGDYREPCLTLADERGMSACDLRYIGYRIYGGKEKLPGLPASFEKNPGDMESLDIEMEDAHLNLSVTLHYAAFADLDVIARSVTVCNRAESPVSLRRVLSANLELPTADYDLLSLHGGWARERHEERAPLRHGKTTFDSFKGVTSNENNNFIALCEPHATEETGEVYGSLLLYSGNYLTGVDVYQTESTRVFTGINPEDFSWKLEKNESFQSPEAILSYSANGIGTLSRTLHDFFRDHIIRGKFKHTDRPVLINSWEAFGMGFDEERMLNLAREAADCGIEMVVMDDGWFGHRNAADSSLGDWTVDKRKLPHGLKHLVDEVNKLGLKFGIWIEPEMISPDSDLYRAHPDWCLHLPGRERHTGRNQLVLDLSRPEVRANIDAQIHALLQSANIEYVKWDNNRSMCDVGNEVLPSDRQRELWHRQVLGLYELQEHLVTDFPDILFENCSGGGARFDGGMLYYSPQIWCSDDTDAIERLAIQRGTSLCYPVSSFGAHISQSPNQCLGRATPVSTRADVALCGTFGYELDLSRMPEEEKKTIRVQVAEYHKYNALVREGDYYRLDEPSRQPNHAAWMFVSKEKDEALFTYVHILNVCNAPTPKIRFAGLNPDATYREEGSGRLWSGRLLLAYGMRMPYLHGDFQSWKLHLLRV